MLVKYLEPGELYRFLVNHVPVGPLFFRLAAPAVHLHDDLYFGQQLDVLIIGQHRLGETVHDQNLRGQVVQSYQARQVGRCRVDFFGIEGADFRAGAGARFHRKLRVNAQMHVRHGKESVQLRQFFLQRTQADLDVQNDDGVYFFCDGQRLFDLRPRHPLPVFIALPGASLCGDGDVMNSRHHGRQRVRLLPFFQPDH